MTDALEVVNRLVAATNAHDLDALVACFDDDYVNETPAHPLRGFRGPAQVGENWRAIFAGIPDISVRVTASARHGNEVWSEWRMDGTRHDGARHTMAGVIIFGVTDDRISSARFYLEPVETTTGDVSTAIGRVVSERAS
ncbi:MAG TPA: nuclear transport factor 2 family protein [Candidatus Limnocylindria bacterium]|jgi:limonene-1,2-epoxide hydrolase|nr:nuclear transport factor 2 family protein [Candidatus Limnocylindria bacterium]